MEVELGAQVDHFSESYGEGDLFADLDEPSTDDVPDEDDPLRYESDETDVGGYAELRWRPGGALDRRATLLYEQDSRSILGRVRGAFEIPVRDDWSVLLDEYLRVQRTEEDDGGDVDDVVQSAEVSLRHRRSFDHETRVSIRQELTRVTSDVIYDYTLHALSGVMVRPVGDLTMRSRLEWAYRDADDVYSNRHQVRGEVGVDRYALLGPAYDALLRVIRTAYDDTGDLSPSGIEANLELGGGVDLDAPYRLEVDGHYDAVRYDDPDPTYDSTLYGDVLAMVRTVSVTGPTVGLGLGGEWLRPQTGGGRAYDQGRVVATASYLGPAGLWLDVEESVGVRSYVGGASSSTIVTDVGALDFGGSDFLFHELTVLVGFEWQALTGDVFVQHTVEAHDEADPDTDEDVSFLLVNARVGVTF